MDRREQKILIQNTLEKLSYLETDLQQIRFNLIALQHQMIEEDAKANLNEAGALIGSRTNSDIEQAFGINSASTGR